MVTFADRRVQCNTFLKMSARKRVCEQEAFYRSWRRKVLQNWNHFFILIPSALEEARNFNSLSKTWKFLKTETSFLNNSSKTLR